MSNWIWAWFIVGGLLMLSEIIVPGAVLSFLGITAFIVGFLIYGDYINGIEQVLITFISIAFFMLLVVRTVFLRFMPGDTSVQQTDETLEYKGAIVEVVERILPETPGRIKFRDSTWIAQCDDFIEVGENAVISAQKGTSFVVKKLI